MKIFSIIKKSSLRPERPKEDYLVLSKKFPIFAVADGVTLRAKTGKKYPNPSGAAQVAKIFCEKIVFKAEKKYEKFSKKDLPDIFEIANKAVADYNFLKGRTEKTINYFDFDLFSATTSFLLIKDNKAYWFSLCDAGLMIFDKLGKKIFNSPSFSPINGKFLPKNWNKMESNERDIVMHKFRNKLGKNGELLGYGVVDGQKQAVEYLNYGEIDINAGDLAIIYTDGFENYFDSKDFIKMFVEWPNDLDKKFSIYEEKMAKKDKIKYGLERTLVAVKV